MEKWQLNDLFTSYESKEFKNTIDKLKDLIQASEAFVSDVNDESDALTYLNKYIDIASQLRKNFLRAYAYTSLRLSTNAQDEDANAWMNKLQQMSSQTTAFQTKVSKWVPTIEKLDALIQENEALRPYQYHLESIKDRAQYVLSDKEESLISKLTQTGSTAWSRLQSVLTSLLEVEYDGQVVTLSDIRNKAHSKDPEVRKNAYDAEIKAYKKIEESVAFALNGVKGEVNEISRLRGFKTPLDEAVYNSRLERKTLDALIASMRKHLPMFRKYLKRKADLLGHKNGLPWYDLFAPLGSSERTFTSEEAIKYVVKNFKTFGSDLANLAQRSYDEEWIDFTPRSGKRGGAFCFNLHPIKQSRILMNFDGSFSNVITLAHELGHAYHGDRIFNEAILNSSYTMPVAETASTLCETIVKKAALNDSEGEEQLFILEQSLMGTTQVIVDILSRFIFEETVFEMRQNTSLSPKKLNEVMLNAQKEAYGDALDQDVLHPYMWVNKGHYYSGSLSFYNFPYAFGLLFAKGLYAQFQTQGASFAKEIDTLLQKTGQMSVEDVAKLVNIDVSEEAFWDQSLSVIKEEIDLFLEITK